MVSWIADALGEIEVGERGNLQCGLEIVVESLLRTCFEMPG